MLKWGNSLSLICFQNRGRYGWFDGETYEPNNLLLFIKKLWFITFKKISFKLPYNKERITSSGEEKGQLKLELT